MFISNNLVATVYIYTMVFAVGAIIGSFLNVVALRLLSGESFVMPCSKCPKCHTPLKWNDNIPILGYLLLGGKCRYCKDPISPQYPLVEAFTGIMFVLIVIFFGISLNSLFLMILSALLIVMTVTDLREQVIFDIISIPVIPIGLIYNFFNLGHTSTHLIKYPLEGIGMTLVLNEAFISAFIGAIAGALFFEIASRLGIIMVGQRAFGEGDSIIAAGLGAWFGWQNLLVIIVLSFVFQLIVGLPVIVHNMYKDKDYKSLVAMGLLLLSMAIPNLGQMLGLTKYFIGAILTTLVAFAIAGVCVVIILQKAKERQSFTFLPFGPALVFGGFVVMFAGQQLIHWYTNSFNI